MDTSKILWVDLRFSQDQISSYHCLSEVWAVSRINNTERLDLAIRKTSPTLLCFEYDSPDKFGLSALQQVKRLFPSIPIMMLTEQHSEALVIWVLRLHIWDYFIKPIQPRDLVASAATILAQEAFPQDKIPLLPHQPLNILLNHICVELRSRPSQNKKTYPAQSFVKNHYHEKIYEEAMAQLCRMNVSTFSRSFKQEYQINFSNYVINYRIYKAQNLLQETNIMVADVAYAVGFNDPSYFTRIFQRNVGMSPSRYLKAQSTKIQKGRDQVTTPGTMLIDNG